MIYLAYSPVVEISGALIPVNGHRSRVEAISNYLDGYTMMSLGDTKPNYGEHDIVIIDPGNQPYEHLLDANVFSVLISDQFGVQYQATGADLVVYVSGGAEDFSWEAESIGNHMFYVVGRDTEENSWIGGDTVLFIPGGNHIEFWKKAKPFLEWCQEHDVPHVVATNIEHKELMARARLARCVVTASGVTLKEMVYQAVPVIAVLTADNQLANYSYFVYNKMAAPQDVDPDIIGDEFSLNTISRQSITSAYKKINTKHMLEMIMKVYNEIYRRN